MTFDDITALFASHVLNPVQTENARSLRQACQATAELIKELTPEGPEQTLAIRHIHAASMLAVLAVSLPRP